MISLLSKFARSSWPVCQSQVASTNRLYATSKKALAKENDPSPSRDVRPTEKSKVSSNNDNEENWFSELTQSKNTARLNKKLCDLHGEEKRQAIEANWKARVATFRQAPSVLTEDYMQTLMKCETWSYLEDTFRFLAKREFYAKRDAEKKELNRKRLKELELEREKLINSSEGLKVITSYPGANSPFRRLSSEYHRTYYRHRAVSAYMNKDPSIVIDFEFTNNHKKENRISSMYRQLIEIIYYNREVAHMPLQMHWCNYTQDTQLHQRYADSLAPDSNIIFQTSKSYLDVFPREKLVYLSSDSRKKMTHYDPNKVYIIGNIIDMDQNFKYATLNKAQQDGIECVSLPLDYYVNWKGSSKNLNVDQVFKILSSLYNGYDWTDAIKKSVPKRTIY